MQRPRRLSALARYVRRETAGEALPTEPRKTAGIVPEQSVFCVETVESRRF